jgi:centrin-2/centrin-1
LLRAFRFLDKDGDGWISLADLSQDAEELGETLDVDELREIIMNARGKAHQFDIHTKDVGMISESDFVSAIMRLYH